MNKDKQNVKIQELKPCFKHMIKKRKTILLTIIFILSLIILLAFCLKPARMSESKSIAIIFIFYFKALIIFLIIIRYKIKFHKIREIKGELKFRFFRNPKYFIGMHKVDFPPKLKKLLRKQLPKGADVEAKTIFISWTPFDKKNFVFEIKKGKKTYSLLDD